MFPTIQDCKHTWHEPLVLEDLDGLLLNIGAYFPFTEISKYDWIGNPFAKYDFSEEWLELAEEL